MENNKNLHFQFNELGFVVNADYDILDKLYQFWYLSLDLVYAIKNEDDWFISIQPTNNIRSYCEVDYMSRTIIFYNPCPNSIEYINSFLREFITKILLTYGYIWLHASAFCINGCAYLVLGKKGFGKTTHLLNAQNYHNAEIIGNDQVPIKVVNGHVCTFRWRPDVKIAPSTLALVGNKHSSDEFRNCDRFLLMPNINQYAAIDFSLLSKLRHQIICPLLPAAPKYSRDKCFPISHVIMLDDTPNLQVEMITPDRAHQLWQSTFREDTENIVPEDLLSWNSRIPFWRERLQNLVASREVEEAAIETLQCLFEKSSIYRVNRRINLFALEYLEIFKLEDVK